MGLRGRRVLTASLLVGLVVSAASHGDGGPAGWPGGAQAAADPKGRPPGPAAWEALFHDESTLKLTVALERVELTTPYGKLQIPHADIRRIDFALRVPDEIARQIDAAVANLSDKQFSTREAAAAELLRHGVKAIPSLRRATQSPDPEVVDRAEGVLEKLRQNVPAEQLEIPELDVVFTKDSKIAGRIEGEPTWAAQTAQFGEVKLRLSDLRRIGLPGSGDGPESSAAAPDPGNLVGVQNKVGTTFAYRVTGAREGPVWGSGPYSVDSALGVAGLLQPGQTGVVRVKILGMQPSLRGSAGHGVMSMSFMAFPSFQFVK
jgi:hypothetical protein